MTTIRSYVRFSYTTFFNDLGISHHSKTRNQEQLKLEKEREFFRIIYCTNSTNSPKKLKKIEINNELTSY